MELLQGLAIFGIIMMVLIAIALQHVVQIVIRTDSGGSVPFAVVIFLLSILLLYLSFNFAVELF